MEREAAAYDEKAVQEHMRKQNEQGHLSAAPHKGCPSSRTQRLQHSQEAASPAQTQAVSRLGQWPCQIRLAPINAPYFDGAKLLIAADCSAYAYARMHEDFIRGKITLIGCPKLDSVRMEVPCCGGLELAAKTALQASGKFIPWQIVTLSVDGRILE